MATTIVRQIDSLIDRISTAQTLCLVAADAGAILQRAPPPNQVGQTRQRCRVAPVLAHVHRRAATDDRVIFQGAVDAGLRGDRDAVSDRRMVGASYLPAEQAPFADSRRARDSRLTREARVLADFAVVPDMNLVVEFDAAMQHRRSHHRAIDRRIRADLPVVLEYHAADLWNFD